jgi:ERCC4-related helicase
LFLSHAVNVPLRDYQFAITKKALFSNTLVALPTGLGKTLIAAVVMYNYFRWFPDGKVLLTYYLAQPTSNLVTIYLFWCQIILFISVLSASSNDDAQRMRFF